MFILGYIHQNIAGKFASNLVFSVVLENFIYAKPIQKYVYLSVLFYRLFSNQS